jgi:hypothetical protein
MSAGWYSGEGEKRFRSVTGLLKPAYQAALEERHEDEISEDAMDGIWRLMGSAMHKVVEKGAEAVGLSEQRLKMTIAGQVITGGADLLRVVDGGYMVTDFKFTSVWSYVYALKDHKAGKRTRLTEWIEQVNMYCLLYAELGFEVAQGEVCLIFRDWSKGKAHDRDYPPPSVTLPLEIWPREKQLAFAEARVREHLKAVKTGGTPCTPEERWSKPAKFAVMKGKNKKASKVCDTQAEAEAYIRAKKLTDAKVDVRPGADIRCDDYCAARDFCPWYSENHAPF